MKNKLKNFLKNLLIYFFVGVAFLISRRKKREGISSLNMIKKILIIKPDGIGDFILFTPFLRELRKNAPEAKIVLICTPSVSNLAELCPYLNKIRVFKFEIVKFKKLPLYLLKMLKFVLFNLREKFNMGILGRWGIDYYYASLFLFFTKTKIKIGYSEKVDPMKAEKNKNFDKFFDIVMKDSYLHHEVIHNLNILKNLGGKIYSDDLEIWINEQDKEYASEVLKGIKNRFLIGICIGANAENKKWPVEYYLKLSDFLIKNYNTIILILGGNEDIERGEFLAKKLKYNVKNLCGKTTLRECAALFQKVNLCIGNDTGLIHIAAAVKTPCVVISCHAKEGTLLSERSPHRFHPWKTEYIIIQPDKFTSPCKKECMINYPHCILNVSPDKVIKKVQEFIKIHGLIKNEENN